MKRMLHVNDGFTYLISMAAVTAMLFYTLIGESDEQLLKKSKVYLVSDRISPTMPTSQVAALELSTSTPAIRKLNVVIIMRAVPHFA